MGKGKRNALALDALISVAIIGATQAVILVPLTAFLAKRFDFVSPIVIVGAILIVLMMDILVIGLAAASARSQRDQFEDGGEECE